MRRALCMAAGCFGYFAVDAGFTNRPGPAIAFALLACVCWSARLTFAYRVNR